MISDDDPLQTTSTQPGPMASSLPHPDSRAALAQAVKQRRGVLNLSQRSLYASGGPSPVTLHKVENPSADYPMSPQTLEKLDASLQWEPGTSRNLLIGEVSPEQASRQDRAAIPSAHDTTDDPLSPRSWVLTLSQETINYILDTYDRGDSELHQRGERLIRELSDHYTTALLETYGGPDKETPPLLQALIGRSLSAEEPPQGSPEHERWLYRRWLVGMPVGQDADQRFQKHWQRRLEGHSE